MSEAALRNGAEAGVLFVDAANPVSTRLYRILGCQPRQERLFVVFDD